MITPRVARAAGAGGFVLLNVLIRLPALHQPLDRDMTAYATIGQQIGNGLVPYRDLFDHKQPLIYPVYWLLSMLSAHSTELIRVAAALFAGVAAAALFYLLSKDNDWVAPAATALLATFAGASTFVEGVDLNTEHLLVLTGAIAVMVPLGFANSSWSWLPLATGVLVGLAVLSKASGLFVAPAALVPLLMTRHLREQSAFSTIVRFGLGIGTLLLLALLVFTSLGALNELYEANVAYNRAYVAVSPHSSLAEWVDFPPLIRTFVALALVGFLLRIGMDGKIDTISLTAIAWLIGAGLGAELSNRPYPHYFAPMIIPIALTLSLPFLRPPPRDRRIAIAGGVALAMAAVPFLINLAGMRGKTPVALAERMYGPQAQIWATQQEAGDFLRARADPNDRLMVAGAEPGFYWTSELRPASYYIYDYPIQFDPEFVSRVERDLSDPPRFVVLPYGQWPPYMASLQTQSYSLIHTIGSVQILELGQR